MNLFTDMKLKVYESYENKLITESELDSLLSLISEKEEDYDIHMSRKLNASAISGRGIDEMPNKKYTKDKDITLVKSTRKLDNILKMLGKNTDIDKNGNYTHPITISKADLQYAEKEFRSKSAGRKEYVSQQFSDADILALNKALQKLRQADSDPSENAAKTYAHLHKFISRKMFNKEVSDFTYPFRSKDLRDKDGKSDKDMEENFLRQHRDKTYSSKYYNTKEINKIKLPPGTYYHSSEKDGKTVLNPHGGGEGENSFGLAGKKKRVWITRNVPRTLYGSNVYKLLKVPEYGFADHHDNSPDNYGNMENGPGTQYYIEIDKPIPVIQVIRNGEYINNSKSEMTVNKLINKIEISRRNLAKSTIKADKQWIQKYLNDIEDYKNQLNGMKSTDLTASAEAINKLIESVNSIKTIKVQKKKEIQIKQNTNKPKEDKKDNTTNNTSNNTSNSAENTSNDVISINVSDTIKNENPSDNKDKLMYTITKLGKIANLAMKAIGEQNTNKKKNNLKNIEAFGNKLGSELAKNHSKLKKSKSINESAMDIDDKIFIHEAYSNGIITREECDEYLSFYY